MKQVLLIIPIMEMKEAEAWSSQAQPRSMTQNWNPNPSFFETWISNHNTMFNNYSKGEETMTPNNCVCVFFFYIILKAPDCSSYN